MEMAFDSPDREAYRLSNFLNGITFHEPKQQDVADDRFKTANRNQEPLNLFAIVGLYDRRWPWVVNFFGTG